MTTVDLDNGNPTLAQFMLWKFSKAMSRSKTKAATRASVQLQVIIRVVMHIAGFACLTYAAFTWSTIAGWAVAGISCFLMSWLTAPSATEPPTTPRR